MAEMLGCRGPALKLRLGGWQQTMHLWQAGEGWPRLPGCTQKALNASLDATHQQAKVEPVLRMGEFAAMSPSDPDGQACNDAAAASRPPCKNYIASLARFVCLHARDP
eukprot:15441791-Alexandrium_andersonii.AAC.1